MIKKASRPQGNRGRIRDVIEIEVNEMRLISGEFQRKMEGILDEHETCLVGIGAVIGLEGEKVDCNASAFKKAMKIMNIAVGDALEKIQEIGDKLDLDYH